MGRGRFKGWRSPKSIAAMTPEEKAEYDALVAKVNAEREAEKLAKQDPNYIPPEPDDDGEDDEPSGRILLVQRAVELAKDQDERFKDADWLDEVEAKGDLCETTISHCSREGYCILETNETYWIKQIVGWLEQFPEKVYVESFPYTNEDMIRVRLPYAIMKKCKPRKGRELTDEQKEAFVQRTRKARGLD